MFHDILMMKIFFCEESLCPNTNYMNRIISVLLLSLISIYSFSQNDTLFSKTLSELVVTATRTERKLSNVAVPVQIISRKAITQSGSVRLNDILAEQTGLYITSGGATTSAGGGVFGNGIQIQGLSPDYTLILLDGEPIIGRQGGVIDLSRLAVGNIKKDRDRKRTLFKFIWKRSYGRSCKHYY